MSNFEFYQLIFTSAAFIFQVLAMWLCYKQIVFSKKYSKVWASAFIIFFITMCITFVRRITVIGDIVDIWGPSPFLLWSDKAIIPLLNSIGWITFLYLLRRWWKGFFGKFFNNHVSLQKREVAVQKREEIVAHKEKSLLITNPNGIHVEEPEKIIVELGDKQVHIDHPKKVIVVNPKSVIEE
jgi:hypothetical protein